MFRLVRHLAIVFLALGTALFAVSASAATKLDEELGVYLYETTCDELRTDAIVEDLGDLEVERFAISEWRRLSQGQDRPSTLYIEDEDVRGISIQELMDLPHAIAVHESDSRQAAVIACGDITGELVGGALLIELHEVNDSGWEGRAHIAPDRRGREIEFTTGIWAAGAVPPLASPVASPAATPAT